MKILLLGDIASAHLQKWVISLAQNEIEIGVFSFNHAEVNWWDDQERITILHQSSKKKSSNTFLIKLSYLFLIGKLKRSINFFQPDILHTHYASSYGLIGRLSGFHPFIISVWGTDVMKFPSKNFINKNIITKNFEHADLICATSSALKVYCEKYTLKKCEVIPFGIDFNRFYFSERIISNKTIIGCVKSLEEVYRIDLLIDAFAKIQKKYEDIQLKLLIVGGGSLEKELKLKVKELGIQELVEFTGKISHNDVPSYYQKIDIFCNLSTYESFGVSIIEAMASGAVVVSTETEGAKEIISNNSNGLLIEIGNIEQLIDKIIELIKNPHLRKQLTETALKDVQQKYDWKNNVNEMINQYRKILKQ